MSSTRIVPAVLFLAMTGPAFAGGMSNELLLSSAWCTFSYSKVSGASNAKRYAFRADGTYALGSRAESGSSGPYGSVASQRDGQGGGRWRVQNGELFMSEGGPFEQVPTVLKRNSNGYPIIVADGVEYSQCR